jgi:uncharacterized DUF497 family protein
MRFEWDEDKNRRNLAKHKVSFETAKSVFDDPRMLSIGAMADARNGVRRGAAGGPYLPGRGRRRGDPAHFGTKGNRA